MCLMKIGMEVMKICKYEYLIRTNILCNIKHWIQNYLIHSFKIFKITLYYYTTLQLRYKYDIQSLKYLFYK